jgi:polar amino acid transport system ATP-binding protein
LPDLTIDSLSASYGGRRVLCDVSLHVRRGEVVGLIGPSGSGKSTLLRVLVGLLRPDDGRIAVDGETIDYADPAAVRRMRERLAIVFQQYNLFQNMTALRNVTVAPLKIRGRPGRETEAKAIALLGRVGMADKLHAYPDQLSGGQQQRVAIARALALEPEILLLDEITSALDPELVGEVLDVIQDLAADGMTMLIVSHEMGFIREVACRVVLMADGAVVEEGTPADILDRPRTERARAFVRRVLRHHPVGGG